MILLLVLALSPAASAALPAPEAGADRVQSPARPPAIPAAPTPSSLVPAPVPLPAPAATDEPPLPGPGVGAPPAGGTAAPPAASPRGVFLALLGAALLALLAGWLQRHPPHRGARGPRLLVMGIRLGAVALLGWGLLLAIPPAQAWMAGWLLAATAVAVGWSARDLLVDLVAGVVLLVGRRFSPGDRLAPEGLRGGVLLHVGPTVSLLDRGTEGIEAVPNRLLVRGAVGVDAHPDPPATVRLDLPTGVPAEALRAAVLALVHVSPYVAREPDPRLEPGPRAGSWTLRVRLVSDRHADAFRQVVLDALQRSFGHPRA